MACCKGDEYGNWCHGAKIVWRDPETDEEYCLFHAPAEHKKISMPAFNLEVSSMLELAQAENRFCTLDGTVFPFTITLSNYTLSAMSLNDAVFKKGVLFENLTFNKYLDCSQAIFEGLVTFKNVTFNIGAFFNNTTFNSILEVFNCNVSGKFSLYSDSLPSHMTINFDKLGQLQIAGHLIKPAFHLNLSIGETTASSYIELQKSTVYSLSPPSTLTVPIYFKDCNFPHLDLSYFRFLKRCVMTGCSFDRLFLSTEQVDDIDFNNCQLPQVNNKTATSDIAPFLLGPRSKDFFQLEDLYRKLKRKTQTEENRRLASDWHYWEKFFCEKRIFREGTAIEWFILRIYRLLSDYGESVEKASGWLVIFILAPLLLAYLSQLPLPKSGIELASIAKQGLDYIPLATRTPISGSWPRFLQLFWQVLITFQATLLGFALRNRYRR